MHWFWLGVHHPGWLAKTSVPLFVSRRRLAQYRRLPWARGPWVLDSGAFTEIATYGRFQRSPQAYALEIQRYEQEIGHLAWAAPQDWMCEPHILKRTGLTVREHQRRTIANYLELRVWTAKVIPVIQGWHPAEYESHVEQYVQAGVDLTKEPVVGIGSVCRRQDMATGMRIVERLWGFGLRLHGFGVKTTGLRAFAHLMVSADSMAWSYDGRRGGRLLGCQHRNCANCLRFALVWRDKILDAIRSPKQWPMVLTA